MITITKIKKTYRLCRSCSCDKFKNDLFLIKIGFDEHQTTSIILCENCIKLIKEENCEKNKN